MSTRTDVKNLELETRTFRKGDIFGEGELLYRGKRLANYVCEDPCEVLLVDADDVIKCGLYDVFKQRRGDIVALLRQNELFSKWPDKSMEEMTSSGHVSTITSNRLVDQTSYTPQWVWFVLKGSMDLWREVRSADISPTLSSKLNVAFSHTRRQTTPIETSYRETDKCVQFLDELSRDRSFISQDTDSPYSKSFPHHIQSATDSQVTSSSARRSSVSTEKSESDGDDVFVETSVVGGIKKELCSQTSMMSKKSHAKKLPEVLYFKVTHFTKGSFFNFKYTTRSRGMLHLVSGGATIMGVPISVFIRYQTPSLVQHFHGMLDRLPTLEYLVAGYIRSLRWKQFKKDFVQSSCIHHRSRDRDDQSKHRRACYYWRPVSEPMSRGQTPANHRSDTSQSIVSFMDEEERFSEASVTSIRRLASGGFIMPNNSQRSGVIPRLLNFSAPLRRRTTNVKL